MQSQIKKPVSAVTTLPCLGMCYNNFILFRVHWRFYTGHYFFQTPVYLSLSFPILSCRLITCSLVHFIIFEVPETSLDLDSHKWPNIKYANPSCSEFKPSEFLYWASHSSYYNFNSRISTCFLIYTFICDTLNPITHCWDIMIILSNFSEDIPFNCLHIPITAYLKHEWNIQAWLVECSVNYFLYCL